MARVSIYISDELKIRMDAAGDAINWSEVARPAFLSALTAHEHRKAKTVESAIERLRASKTRWRAEVDDFGNAEGRAWAENHAEYEDLVALAAIDLKKFDPEDEYDLAHAFERALDPTGKRPEWVQNVVGVNNGSNHGVSPDERTGPQIYAFVEGVQEFFAEVKGRL